MDTVTRAVMQNNKKKKHLPVGECFFLSVGCLVSQVSGYSAFHAEATPSYGGSMSCVRPIRFPARRLE